MATLYIRESAGFREAGSEEILHQAHSLMARRFRKGSPVLTTPNKVRDYLKLHVGALDYELFGVLHLDTRRHLIAVEDLFRGTIDAAAVHVREVVKSALRYGSSALIAWHNHPSGNISPSPADEPPWAQFDRLRPASSGAGFRWNVPGRIVVTHGDQRGIGPDCRATTRSRLGTL